MECVWESDEAAEVSGRANGPDTHVGQMIPISFPSLANWSSAKSI